MVGIEEFGGEIGEGLVVQLKLTLERSVGDSTALTEECQDLIEHGIEVHYRSSLSARWRPPATLNPALAGFDDEIVVHPQRLYGGSACGRLAGDARAVMTPRKVVFPSLYAGIEEGYWLAREWVSSVCALAFATIAAPATQPQVHFHSLSTQRFRDNVFHFHRSTRKFLGSQAVTTAMLSLCCNPSSKDDWYGRSAHSCLCSRSSSGIR
jgi:hypothetical protein